MGQANGAQVFFGLVVRCLGGLFCFGFATVIAWGEPPTPLALVDSDTPHLRKWSVPVVDRNDSLMQGPLPSFVKVWPQGHPEQPLDFSFNQDATMITLHLGERMPETVQFLLAEKTAAYTDGTVVLSALDAKVFGEKAALETHPGSHRIGFWDNPDDYVTWDAEIPQGKYQVELVYSRATRTGTRVTVAIGKKEFPVTLEQTGSWYRYRVKTLGDLIVENDGKTHIKVSVDKIAYRGVMNLKAVVLTRKKQARGRSRFDAGAG